MSNINLSWICIGLRSFQCADLNIESFVSLSFCYCQYIKILPNIKLNLLSPWWKILPFFKNLYYLFSIIALYSFDPNSKSKKWLYASNKIPMGSFFLLYGGGTIACTTKKHETWKYHELNLPISMYLHVLNCKKDGRHIG